MMTIKEIPVTRCSFASWGTYGHECGEMAVAVAVRRDCTDWVDGIFYGGRCEKCATIRGGENAGTTIEPLNGHVNRLSVWRAS